MEYSGQSRQIDVKFVPSVCLVGDTKGQKFYQYPFIDEYRCFRYLEAFENYILPIRQQCLFAMQQKSFPMPLNVFKQIIDQNSPTGLTQRGLVNKHYLNVPCLNRKLNINYSVHLCHSTTEMLKEVSVRTMKNSMLLTNFILSKIFKGNLLYAKDTTTNFLCVP